MDRFWELVAVLLIVLLLLLLRNAGLLPKRITVFEFERGLRYRGGRAAGVLGPGQYWLNPISATVIKVDMRPRFATLSGQEVLSADGVPIKLSLAAQFEVVDPEMAINQSQDYQGALYLELQLALRGIAGSQKVDELLAERAEIGRRLQEEVADRAEALGLRLLGVDVKDLMFPGELKRIFSQVVKARQEGLAALERARGETAALRNLANAAKMVEDTPALWQLRLLQQIGAGTGNTVVLGLPNATPLPVAPRGQQKGQSPAPDAEEG
ncbi:MAG: slipin family protein [Chloroflexota bacterium]